MSNEELMNRLREPSANKPTINLWDSIQRMLIEGNRGDLPNQIFEMILNTIDMEKSAAADAIEALDSQLAERDKVIAEAVEVMVLLPMKPDDINKIDHDFAAVSYGVLRAARAFLSKHKGDV